MKIRTIGSVMTLLLSTSAIAQSGRPWSDPKLSPDTRATLVEAEMSLDEKIAMVNGTFGGKLRLANPTEKRIGAGHVPGVPRLGIPDLYETDAGLGVTNTAFYRPGDVATAMPSNLAVAASFDPAIAYASGATIGAEARAKGFNVILAGGATLIRDPWGGRSFEYLSEDPLLTGVMAGESIRGVQSNGILSTIKHYALNAQETGRYVLDARMPEKALRESDLLAFQIAIERGQPGSVMCGYNKVNGDWDCENGPLLNGALKRDWQYKGWVMSDWGATHSAAKAAKAGLDQESGQELDAHPYFDGPLKAAVQAGDVPQARLDDMVHRILRTMFANGLVDNPPPATPEKIDYAAHAKIAEKAAATGMVLLRNQNGLLPLTGHEKHIVVIGSHADIGVLSGGGSSQVYPVSGMPIHTPLPGNHPELSFIKFTYDGSSPLAAIRARAPQADITYVDTLDPAKAAEVAKSADAVIVFANQWRSEALDAPSLSLPDGQDALIDAIGTANPRTVVVLESGGAVLMPWLDKVGGVLEAWYPGERGGEAITSVLYGDVDATGRLPVTFPASAAQAPRPTSPGLDMVQKAMDTPRPNAPHAGEPGYDLSAGEQTFPVDYPEGADAGYRWYQRTAAKPLFPFGFGLSYTRFSYAGLEIRQDHGLHVRFTVTNTGTRAGSDVPQVYGTPPGGKAPRRLVGFQRVTLAPGASQVVDVAIEPRMLASFDMRRNVWAPLRGTIAIGVGHDVEAIALRGTATIAK